MKLNKELGLFETVDYLLKNFLTEEHIKGHLLESLYWDFQEIYHFSHNNEEHNKIYSELLNMETCQELADYEPFKKWYNSIFKDNKIDETFYKNLVFYIMYWNIASMDIEFKDENWFNDIEQWEI